jgi:ABC-2 type transport system ATP-binding protein
MRVRRSGNGARQNNGGESKNGQATGHRLVAWPATAGPESHPVAHGQLAQLSRPFVHMNGVSMNTVSSPAITARGLRKAYGDKLVLDDIDLDIPAGRIWALLGPNGAGKTTMVQILTTLIRADAGTIHVGGHDVAADPDAVRRMIGVTGQFAAVDDMLTGEENLVLMGDLHHQPKQQSRQRASQLLDQLHLQDAAGKMASTYSGGMRRKLDLAMTLVGDPRIIFLDEPTTGLDPRSRHAMWQLIEELVAGGVTVFLTTQYLEEADQLADQVAVLDRGTLVAQGTPAQLKSQVGGGHILLTFDNATTLDEAVRTLGDVAADEPALDHEALTVRVPSDGGLRSIRQVLDRLGQVSAEPAEFSVHTPDLDDVFLSLTGRSATDGGNDAAAKTVGTTAAK